MVARFRRNSGKLPWVAVPRKLIATTKIDQLQRRHHIHCNMTDFNFSFLCSCTEEGRPRRSPGLGHQSSIPSVVSTLSPYSTSPKPRPLLSPRVQSSPRDPESSSMVAHGPLLSEQQTPSGIPKTESPHPPLSNHALRFGNGGLYLDSAEAPVIWHGTSTVAVPRRPIATAGIDQL